MTRSRTGRPYKQSELKAGQLIEVQIPGGYSLRWSVLNEEVALAAHGGAPPSYWHVMVIDPTGYDGTIIVLDDGRPVSLKIDPKLTIIGDA